MQSLDEIGIIHGTDKASNFHDYLRRYEPFFESLRKLSNAFIVEAGVDGGASIRAWANYFPNANIVGIDHNNNCWKPSVEFTIPPGISRVEVIIADVTSSKFWDENNWSIDAFIDDASHYSRDIIRTFKLVWDKIASGGIYLCEDLHSEFDARYRAGSEITALEYFKSKIGGMNHFGDDQCGKQDKAKSDIDYIHFSKSFVIIKKL